MGEHMDPKFEVTEALDEQVGSVELKITVSYDRILTKYCIIVKMKSVITSQAVASGLEFDTKQEALICAEWLRQAIHAFRMLNARGSFAYIPHHFLDLLKINYPK